MLLRVIVLPPEFSEGALRLVAACVCVCVCGVCVCFDVADC